MEALNTSAVLNVLAANMIMEHDNEVNYGRQTSVEVGILCQIDVWKAIQTSHGRHALT